MDYVYTNRFRYSNWFFYYDEDGKMISLPVWLFVLLIILSVIGSFVVLILLAVLFFYILAIIVDKIEGVRI